jgi:hypothetical protein
MADGSMNPRSAVTPPANSTETHMKISDIIGIAALAFSVITVMGYAFMSTYNVAYHRGYTEGRTDGWQDAVVICFNSRVWCEQQQITAKAHQEARRGKL